VAKRSIINPAYETQADSIVGKMTIKQLDREMLALEIGVLRLRGAAGLFRGFALLGSGVVVANTPQVVLISEAKQAFAMWADQVVDFFTKSKTRIANVSVEGAKSPPEIAKVYDTAAGLAGSGGIVIINAGHGFPSATGVQDDGRFDLAPPSAVHGRRAEQCARRHASRQCQNAHVGLL
jgi:hypothetical protein